MRRNLLLRRLFFALLVLLVAGGGAAFYLSREMNRAADGFFGAVRADRFPEARSFLAESFRSSTADAPLKKLLAESELLDADETAWTVRKSAHGYGELSGSVTRKSGAVVPVKLLFVREKLAWKVYAIRRPFTGSLPQPIAPLLPDKAEQVTLVKRALHDFAASVQSRNMSYFRSTLAPSRRELYSTEKLNEAFGSFFDIQEDLSTLENVEPRVEESRRSTENGEVTLSGYFATSPKQVRFLQKYAYEQADWRLLSFKVDMQ